MNLDFYLYKLQKRYLLCFILSVLLFVSGIYAQNKPVYLDKSKSIDERVENALSMMSLEEKVAMVHAQSKFSSGGVPRLGIPELWMDDGPHGVRAEVLWDAWKEAGWTNDSCTAFPALTCLAATWNPQMAYLYGKSVGEEARYRKKDILLGPGVNIYRSPLNGRNFEYMGEDPYLSSVMVVPYIKGVQENGVSACVKHFALNNQETRRGYINVIVSDRALNEIYLPAFKAAVTQGGVWSLMAAYNKYNGTWCAHNKVLLKQILKNEWGFKGVVVSDWDAVHNTLDAAESGLDIEMGTHLAKGKSYNDYYLADPYLKALRSGVASTTELDNKVRRILALIFRTAMNPDRPWGSFATKEHALASRKIVQEGIVLLKNEGSLLPLNSGRIKSIAVIGENAVRKMTEGGGSSALKVKKEVSPLEGLQNKFGGKVKITYSQGYSHDKAEPSMMEDAVKAAASADVVLYFGGLSKDNRQDSEGEDRQEYALPFNQNELINRLTKVNRNIVVVLVSGNAAEMPWSGKVPAIVEAWYGGSEAGNAIADVLSGDVNPSGKLPFTINRKLSDYGSHSAGEFPGDSVNVVYKDDILVGYRWNDTKGVNPLFPFGHGLSYTRFSYGKPLVDKSRISADETFNVQVPVKNMGSRKGEEVVQLYIHDVRASVMRPDKELKAFQKVELVPGEEKVVSFQLNRNALSFYNDKTKSWVAEPGSFEILIGSSSRDIRQRAKFELK